MNNTSFNSMSSLTSVPLSSQASSSRRIVKDGIPLVTNSDSGSAGDSEDELQDIVIPRKKMRMTPPPPAEDEIANAIEVPSTIKPPGQRHSGRISAGNSKKSQPSSRSHTPRRRLSPPPPRYANANSLLRLVREKEKREKAEARIREAEAAFETEQKNSEEKAQRERDLGGGLKALVAEDSDEGERMMLAVERTEATGRGDEEWYYFRGVRDDAVANGVVEEPRPDDIVAFAPWQGGQFKRLKEMVVDAGARKQAALSGFLAEVAGRYGLPPELLDWMFARLVREGREELCEAYVEVFRRHLQRESRGASSSWENWPWLSRVYRTVDVPPGSESGRGQREERNSGARIDAPPSGLRHVVRVVQYSCSNSGDGIPHLNLLELALASVDAHVSRDAELKGQLQESIAAIIDSVDPAGITTIAHTISSHFSTLSLPLRCRIIAALPTYTEKCHRLRRMLALYLVVCNQPVPKPDATKGPTQVLDPDSPRWAEILLSRLRAGGDWHISESTDYAHLNALIPILDIAIDAGFQVSLPTTPSITDTHPITTTHPNPTFNPQTSKSTPFPTKALHQPSSEKSFNAQIDTLTDTLRLLAARIRDAGTSHLRRTEAKSALERVVVRLEHCVRTRPRPRKGVFGGGAESKGFMSGFLQQDGGAMAGKKVDRRGPEDRASVISTGRLSDRGGDSEAESEDAGGGAEGDEF